MLQDLKAKICIKTSKKLTDSGFKLGNFSKKNFRFLIERNQSIEKEIKALKSSVETLSALFSENKLISKREIKDLIAELSKESQEKKLNQKLLRVELLLAKIEKQIFG